MLDQHQKAFIKALQLNAYRHHPREVFTDWCEMAACALANPFDLTQREGREARYLRIVKKYNPDEVARLSEMLALLTLSLEDHFSDALGAIYMNALLEYHTLCV